MDKQKSFPISLKENLAGSFTNRSTNLTSQNSPQWALRKFALAHKYLFLIFILHSFCFCFFGFDVSEASLGMYTNGIFLLVNLQKAKTTSRLKYNVNQCRRPSWNKHSICEMCIKKKCSCAPLSGSEGPKYLELSVLVFQMTRKAMWNLF